MKNLHFGIVLLFFCACSGGKTGENTVRNEKVKDSMVAVDSSTLSPGAFPDSPGKSLHKTGGKKHSPPGDFESLFETIEPQDFMVSSSMDFSRRRKDYRVFAGRLLDKGSLSLFRDIKPGRSGIYACHKFALNDSVWALIVRHASGNRAGNISLYLWNENTKKLLPSHRLLSDYQRNGYDLFVQDTRITQKGTEPYLFRVSLKRCFIEMTDSSTFTQRCEDSSSMYIIEDNVFREFHDPPL